MAARTNQHLTSGSSGRLPSCHGACSSKPRATSAAPLSHTVGRASKERSWLSGSVS